MKRWVIILAASIILIGCKNKCPVKDSEKQRCFTCKIIINAACNVAHNIPDLFFSHEKSEVFILHHDTAEVFIIPIHLTNLVKKDLPFAFSVINYNRKGFIHGGFEIFRFIELRLYLISPGKLPATCCGTSGRSFPRGS